ncbi:MAG: hypothetical protein WCY24_06795 [Lutispora sp.]
MNFTSESIKILVIFLGMTAIAFLISLPYVLKKEDEADKDIRHGI